MKKRLFKSLLVISFLLITFFSVINKTNAANFTYKDFKWEEFSKSYNTYWVSFCETSNDENCEDKILKTKKGFYERLYKLLAAAENDGNFIDDDLIIATVFYGLTPESFKDPTEGEYNPYNIDNDESSKDKYVNGKNLDDAAKAYFEEEKDTLKTLVNSFIGYCSHCYIDSNETPQNNTCSNANNYYVDNKCMERINTYKGNFWDSLGIKVFGTDAQTKCNEEASNRGASYGKLITSSTEEVSDEFFWDYLENSNYFDKKEHLSNYYVNVLSKTDKDNMAELIKDEALYKKHQEEIIKVRQRIIRGIKDVLKYDETVSASFKQTKSSLKYWWPIGSDETNEVDGVIMATGEPASVNITSPYGLRNDPFTGESNKMHSGIDISGSLGVTNIIASKDGIVYDVNDGCQDGGDKSCGNGYGNYVIIQHIDNTYTLYAHLNNNSLTVSVNDSVKQGQVIAKLGNSGNSTGPHLHFEVRVGGSDYSSNQNPINFVSSTDTRPSGTESQILEWIGNMEGTGPVNGDNYEVYADSGGVLTVGHGITLKYNADQFLAHGINPSTLSVGSLVSRSIVDAIYQEDLDGRMNNIKSLLSSKGVTLNDNQIAALVSLQFNCGNINGFFENYEAYGSTESLCANWWEQKALHDANGNKLGGLVKRRKAECDLFVNGNYNMNVY